MGLGTAAVNRVKRDRTEAREAELARTQAYERLVEAPSLPPVAADDALAGREVFFSVCAACQGPDGRGVQGLGRNLVESDFVAQQRDKQLYRFVLQARPNAKPVPVLPQGGRTDFPDEDFRAVVAYLRGLQDPRRMPALPELAAAKAPTDVQQQSALAAAGGDAELAKYIANGETIFHRSCVACHGSKGVGMKGNGKALANNDVVRSLDDDALLAFIKQGRSPTDAKSATGIQMPPKGGNPAMSDDDILDVISYLRTLQDVGAVPK